MKSLLNQYIQSENKQLFLKELIEKKEYFQIALFILDIVRDLPKSEKRDILEEIGMLIVQNSQGENLMVESVAKERTLNLLKWLEYVSLIDHNWVPTDSSGFNTKEKEMDSNLRDHLLRIMHEYVNAKTESFGGNPLGRFVRHDVPNELNKFSFILSDQYVITGSVGQGNWASIPWIAIMNKKVTVSTQRGYYIVYLFSEDMERLYLTFAQGVTETSKEEMARIKAEIRTSISMNDRVRKDDDYLLR